MNLDLDPDLDLVLKRRVNAPRHLLYQCWTREEHIPHFFVPRPHRVTACRLDPRVGGAFDTTFDIDGNVMENKGVFLDLRENERLVFTDAYTGDWQPSGKPFMTVVLTFADEGGKTRYITRSRHWSKQDRLAHEEMGFHQGWGICADQLEALAKSI